MEASPNRTFSQILAQTRGAIDTELVAWLRTQSWPDDFDRALRHVLLGAGKAVRPALLFSVAEALTQNPAHSSPSLRRLALSVELMHTYSLVHDDLPSMDDDAFRRGRPTLHVLWNEAFGVLAGDALLTASFQCLGEAFQSEPEKLTRAIALLSRSAGVQGMIGGQWLDMNSAKSNFSSPEEQLETIHRKKTGALIAVSAALGALKVLPLAEFSRIEPGLLEWGEELGLLFQMVDDLLDSVASREQLGKTPGKDAEQGKLTYVALIGRPALEKRIEAFVTKLQVPHFAPSDEMLRDLVAFVARRRS